MDKVYQRFSDPLAGSNNSLDPYAAANNSTAIIHGVGSANSGESIDERLGGLRAPNMARPPMPAPADSQPTTLQALRDENLITEEDLQQLSGCDNFQRGLVLSAACVKHLRDGRTIDFDSLKRMTAAHVEGFKKQGVDDARLATLYTHPCMKIFFGTGAGYLGKAV